MAMLLLVAPLSAATATSAPAKGAGGAISIPISVTSADQGTFNGTLTIRGFAAQRGQIVALGTVAGTLTDENGVRTGIVRNVSQTVTIRRSLASTQQPQGAAQQAMMRKVSLQQQEGCQVLHLDFGPVNLDLAGLAVGVSAVTFDIAGEPGPVGDLVCAVLDLAGNVAAVVNLLNSLLGLLTGLLGGLGGAVGGLG